MAGGESGRVFRIDRFRVPAAARDRFLEIVGATHAVLAAQPGFLRDALVERADGPGWSEIVTLAEWADEGAIAPARAAVADRHREMGVTPAEFLAQAGVEAAFGLYQAIGR